MLRQRILTAVVLLALLLPSLIVAPVWPFALLTLAAMAIAGWEWVRLNDGARYAVALGIALGCRVRAWRSTPAGRAPRRARRGGWRSRSGFSAAPGCCAAASPAGSACRAVLRWAVGLIALWTAWLALANAKASGLNFILSIFFLVWAADVFAYFGGRALGRRKLALAISPGKSWEGVWSGMIGALLVAAGWLAIDASRIARHGKLLFDRRQPLRLLRPGARASCSWSR